MSEICEKAINKLEIEAKNAKYDRYANIMKDSVVRALKDFCRQSEGFSEAVAHGGSFEECMKSVAKNCGNGISDLTAYKRAVEFYMKGATVRFNMEIVQKGGAKKQETDSAEEEPRRPEGVEPAPERKEPAVQRISLDSFF